MSKPLSVDQKTFNKSAQHLLRQRAKSLIPSKIDPTSKTCAYRGNGGLRCAAGPFITNEEYKPSFENQVVRPAYPDGNAVTRLFNQKGLNLLLLRRLQAVHDNYEPDQWVEKLGIVATDFGLKMVKV